MSLLSTAEWSDYTEYYVCLDTVTKSTFDKVNKLERQLEEARGLVFDAYQEGWFDNRNNLDCWEIHWIDSDSKYSLEQLKEKGDE